MARPFWSKAGSPPPFPSPDIPSYSTGTAAGTDVRLVAGNNAALVGPAVDREDRPTAFHRGAMEVNGARLAISPSMKIPQNDPASGMTQANTRIVQSRVGRSRANFDIGAAQY